MHIAVIGRGLIGSAAARHLAKAGHEVTLIGPDEPAERSRHTGVFASHYDEGRITRSLDPWPFWSRVSRSSIARYAEIEAESGLSFFTEAGAMIAGPEDSDLIRRVAEGCERDGLSAETLRDVDLRCDFPFFAFPADTLALYERQQAGYISPRRLVQAQGIAAERAGARILRAEAAGIDETGPGVQVATSAGNVDADRVLVAAGGFTRRLLPGALDLTVYARTAVLLRVPEAEARRLAAMPTLIYLDRSGADPYLLPPIRYPDGHTYIKMGGDPVDIPLADDELGGWFRSDGSLEVGTLLEEMVRERLPGVQVEARHTIPCVTTFTAENIPRIKAVSDRVSVAVAGCGRGAKCSDELGRLAAGVVQGHALPDWATEAAVP